MRKFTALVYAHCRHGRWLKPVGAISRHTAYRTAAADSDVLPEPEAGRYVSEALARGRRSSRSTCRWGLRPRDPLLDLVWGLLADAAVPSSSTAGQRHSRAVHRSRTDR